MKKIITGCVGIVLSLWLNGVIKESLSNTVTDATRATIKSGALDPYPDAKILLSLIPVLMTLLSAGIGIWGIVESVKR